MTGRTAGFLFLERSVPNRPIRECSVPNTWFHGVALPPLISIGVMQELPPPLLMGRQPPPEKFKALGQQRDPCGPSSTGLSAPLAVHLPPMRCASDAIDGLRSAGAPAGGSRFTACARGMCLPHTASGVLQPAAPPPSPNSDGHRRAVRLCPTRWVLLPSPVPLALPPSPYWVVGCRARWATAVCRIRAGRAPHHPLRSGRHQPLGAQKAPGFPQPDPREAPPSPPASAPVGLQ